MNVHLCSRCKASTGTNADHATDADCVTAWRTLAAHSHAAVIAGQKRIAACQRARHMGHRIINREKDLCSGCLIFGYAAFERTASMFGTYSSS